MNRKFYVSWCQNIATTAQGKELRVWNFFYDKALLELASLPARAVFDIQIESPQARPMGEL